jgi:predicted alpha/beta hydrolase family esterase
MSPRTFLIIHGWQASEPEHWQTWLANRLQAANEAVLYPLFPSPDTPVLDEWIEALNGYLDSMAGEKVVICHSLGGILWMHYCVSHPGKHCDRLLLVAPPCPPEISQIEELQGFLPVPIDPEAFSRSADYARLVCSPGDEYCQGNATITYGEALRIEYEVLPHEAGHINVESNYGPWPQVEQWCYDASVNFTDPPGTL